MASEVAGPVAVSAVEPVLETATSRHERTGYARFPPAARTAGKMLSLLQDNSRCPPLYFLLLRTGQAAPDGCQHTTKKHISIFWVATDDKNLIVFSGPQDALSYGDGMDVDDGLGCSVR